MEGQSGTIDFFAEAISTDHFPQDLHKEWIKKIAIEESCRIRQLSFIFCTDDYLLQLNQQYLQHDTLTDILTFPYSDPPELHGDIFISLDRIAENAAAFHTTFEEELARVMVHGVLHLCGYGDKTPTEQKVMKSKEEDALAALKHFNTGNPVPPKSAHRGIE